MDEKKWMEKMGVKMDEKKTHRCKKIYVKKVNREERRRSV